MRCRPTGDELLFSAQKLLRERVLPVVPTEQKHTLLMALNAMSIAERQMRAGDAPDHNELTGLNALLNINAPDILVANQRFSSVIRVGAADPGAPQRASILAQLRAMTRQQIQESNPKLLKDLATTRPRR